MFTASLFLHLLNLMIGIFIEPCVRLLLYRKQTEQGKDFKYSGLYIFGFCSDGIYRIGFFIFTIVQLSWLDSQAVLHCTAQSANYALDASWMHNLAFANLASLPIFAVWRYNTKLEDPQPKAGGRRKESSERSTESQDKDALSDNDSL